MEQPELHLHPRAHPELTELLSSVATAPDGPWFLIETHSDAMILRARVLVAEGKLRPDQVRVYFVEESEQGGELRENQAERPWDAGLVAQGGVRGDARGVLEAPSCARPARCAMRVFIPDSSVFELPKAFESLQRLWRRVCRGYHDLVVADADAVLESDFAKQGVAPYERREWEELVRFGVLDLDFRERTAEPGQAPGRKHVMVVAAAQVPRSPQCLRTLSAEEVGDWAETPLRLLLENNADLLLLLGAVRVSETAPVVSTWLELAVQNKALDVDGRGGCGEVWTTLREIPKLTSPDIRLFIMLDSDRTSEGADVGKAQHNVKRLVDELSPQHTATGRGLLPPVDQARGGELRSKGPAEERVLFDGRREAGFPEVG
jgi:hypothetical protein